MSKLTKAICKVNRARATLVGGSVGAMLMMAGATAAHAQDTPVLEEVVITGIRGGLQNSVAIKRNSTSLVDAISSEDIGKFPDSDVAESLARIPGISVNRQFGQGQQVSIRGASNQLTLTTLNGQSVASTGWYDQQSIDRSFNYSLLPPELIAGIEVYKSSQADLVEGGVGGVVNVKTHKPLDLDAGTLFISTEANYGTVSEEADPGISGLYSWKNDSETFGVLASIALQDTDYVRNGTESLYGWNGAVSVNSFQQQRKRSAYDVAVQFRPTDTMQFGIHYMSLDLEADNTNTSVFMFQNTSAANCDQFAADGVTCVLATMDAGDPNPAAGPYAQTFARKSSMESETIDIDFEFQGDGYVVTARLGQTEAEGGTELTTNHGGVIGQPSDTYGTFDATANEISLNLANPGWNASDFTADVAASGWAEKRQPNTDEETYFQADIEFDVDFKAITSIKVGYRWTDHEVTDESDKAIYDKPIVAKSADHFWSGTVAAGMQGYQVPDPKFSAMQTDALSQISRFVRDRSAYGTVTEENTALYAMANFEAEGIRGNFGFRYVSTEVESDFYGTDNGFVDPDGFENNNNLATTLTTNKADYSEVLPSINLVFDLTDEFVLRTSAAQVMSRPNYADMFSRSLLEGVGNVDPTDQSVTTGNVALEPFKASQADLALEWYYGNGNMVSVGYFIKDVSNFTTSVSKTGVAIGVTDPVCNCDSWTVNSKVNSDGGTIEGIESQIMHAFDNGFGLAANYTFADADAPKENFSDLNGVFSDSSKHTVNLVGYYEREAFSARAAYNWRSEYMIRESGFYGNRLHDDYGTLDLSCGYQLTDNVGITFDALNVLEEDSVQTGVAPTNADIKADLKNGYPAWTFEGEARFVVGINARF